MPLTPKERQRRFVERQKARKLKRRRYWVTTKEAKAIAKLLKEMRNANNS